MDGDVDDDNGNDTTNFIKIWHTYFRSFGDRCAFLRLKWVK